MIRSSLRRTAIRVRVRCGRLADDIRGVAAVEFGVIAPVLIIMLIGVFEVTRAVSIDRRFGQVTSMVADLVAREENMTRADLEAIYDIVDHVMGVWGTDTLTLEVIPVQADPADKNNRKVYAQTTNRPTYPVADGGDPPAVTAKAYCDSYTSLSTELLDAGASVIVVEANYTYKPALVGVLTEQAWTDKAVLAPRNSCVDFDDNNCVSACF